MIDDDSLGPIWNKKTIFVICSSQSHPLSPLTHDLLKWYIADKKLSRAFAGNLGSIHLSLGLPE